MRKRRLKEAPECQLQGNYQDKNQQTAFVALQVLRNYCGVELSREAIAQGFAQVCTLTGLRGRWEILSHNPLTVCDTGHNGHGIKHVAEQLLHLLAQQRQSHPYARLHIVFGMVNDKDVDTVLNYLPEEAVYYFTQPSTPRALPAEELLSRWLNLHPSSHSTLLSNVRPNDLHSSVHYYHSLSQALHEAREQASADDIIFVGGSNYIVGEALRQ